MVARRGRGAYLAVHSAESYPAALAVHVVPIEATMQQKILLALLLIRRSRAFVMFPGDKKVMGERSKRYTDEANQS